MRPAKIYNAEQLGFFAARLIKQYWDARKIPCPGSMLSQHLGVLINKSGLGGLYSIVDTEAMKPFHCILSRRGRRAFVPIEVWNGYTEEEKQYTELRVFTKRYLMKRSPSPAQAAEYDVRNPITNPPQGNNANPNQYRGKKFGEGYLEPIDMDDIPPPIPRGTIDDPEPDAA